MYYALLCLQGSYDLRFNFEFHILSSIIVLGILSMGV